MRRSKYGAVRTTVDGITFDSKREAARYQDLRLLEKAGEIEDLKVQIRYTLRAGAGGAPLLLRSKRYPNGRTASYVADFVYRDVTSGECTIEDTKGFRTDAYRLKAAIMEAMGYRVIET